MGDKDLCRIKSAIGRIRQAAQAGDYEAAHGLEIDLHKKVLSLIAAGHSDAAAMAALALSTADIQFNRWTA